MAVILLVSLLVVIALVVVVAYFAAVRNNKDTNGLEPSPIEEVGDEGDEDKETLIPPGSPTPSPPGSPTPSPPPEPPISPYKIPVSRKKMLIEEELSNRVTHSRLLSKADSLFDENEHKRDTLLKIAALKTKLKDHAIAVAHEMGGSNAVGSEFLNAADAEIYDIMSVYTPDVVPVTLDLAIEDTGPVSTETLRRAPDMTIDVISKYTTEDVEDVPEGHLYVCVVNKKSRPVATGGEPSKLEARNVSLVFINNLGYDVGVTRAYIRADAAGSLKSADNKTVDIASIEDKTPYFLKNGTKRTLVMFIGFDKVRTLSRLHVPLLLSKIRLGAVKPF